MLVDVKVNSFVPYERHSVGVYLYGSFNFELSFRGQSFLKDYPEVDGLDCYGVCDNPEQLISKLGEDVTKGKTPYVISLTPIEKQYQPKQGGWRWEKWGEYIGNQVSKADYLYDEPEIDLVYVYHIYEV